MSKRNTSKTHLMYTFLCQQKKAKSSSSEDSDEEEEPIKKTTPASKGSKPTTPASVGNGFKNKVKVKLIRMV